MFSASNNDRPIADLAVELNRVASDLNALCVIAADESGGVIGVSDPGESALDLATLAALGTANLVSSAKLVALTKMPLLEAGSLITLIEGEQSRLVISGRPGGLIFISLLGAHSPLGLARVEMRELADMNWELPLHSFSEDQLLIDQQLASHDFSDDLFITAGDDEQ